MVRETIRTLRQGLLALACVTQRCWTAVLPARAAPPRPLRRGRAAKLRPTPNLQPATSCFPSAARAIL